MAYRRSNEQGVFGSRWRIAHRALLADYGVPMAITADDRRWVHVLLHDRDPESGWDSSVLSDEKGSQLLALLKPLIPNSAGINLIASLEHRAFNLVGYWTNGVLHDGHSSWAYAFKPDGTGFAEFTNFLLVNSSPIRWKVSGRFLEVHGDTEYTLNFPDRFVGEPSPLKIVVPFEVTTKTIDIGQVRLLSLDLDHADAPDFHKRYQPREYGLAERIIVDEHYHPETARSRRQKS